MRKTPLLAAVLLGTTVLCVVCWRPAGAANPSAFFFAGENCAVPGTSSLWGEFLDSRERGREPVLPDFSYAGYRFSDAPIPDVEGPLFRVTDYGAIASDGRYDDAAIQRAIDAAAAAGGGVVLFPPGEFLVSPTTDVDSVIRLSASHIVLRGSGSGDDGTDIVIVNMKPGSFMFQAAPSTSTSRQLATIVGGARRESFWIEVDRTADLHVGQRVVLRAQDRRYNVDYWSPLELDPEWTRVYQSGPAFHEVHTVAEIVGDRVRLAEPLHFTIVMNGTPFRLHSIGLLEEIGVEDIRFSGRWDGYPEEFVHHKDRIHDAGWNALSLVRLANSWVRRVEFRNLNQAMYVDTGVGLTLERIRLTGKKGHSSISPRRGYGVLVKDSEDIAGHHHGPGFGYSGVGTVYLRHQMQSNQRIDSHGGNPYASLLDDVTGGVLDGNGGPFENYPHHAHYFVFWNFNHRSSGTKTYDFWNIQTRNSSTFARPIIVGLTANRTVSIRDESMKVLRNESFGTRVTPTSLFEAQLTLRHCARQ